MSKKPSGADARDIAIRYLELVDERATSHIMGKTINQAKNLLDSDYTKEEIFAVMEYAILDKKIDVYSFGFFNASINMFLRELRDIHKREEAKQNKESIKQGIASTQASQRNEVTGDDDSTRRNQEKTRRLGVQSGFGKKFNFDMFEGHGQDN